MAHAIAITNIGRIALPARLTRVLSKLRMRVSLSIAALGLIALLARPAAAVTSHSLADHVKDGAAADTIRESYRCFETGESVEDGQTKLFWYNRGKDLAIAAVSQDESDADAHFALFANWGRWLQTDGWLKNAYQLPALRRELDRALELKPNHPDALAAMGGLYLELPRFLGGNATKAEPFLERAIELDPLAVGARLELADCYLQRRHDGARDLATTARRLAVEQGKPHFVRRADALLAEIGPAPEQTQARQ
jgi:tetratricopeptide (TPR) repeat protein